MKRTIFNCVILLGISIFLRVEAQAQGSTTFLSNLGQSPNAADSVGSDSWLATGFRTGSVANGYSLDSIQINLGDALGNPSGFTVMLYTSSGVAVDPGSKLATLTGPVNPTASGTYSYTPSSSLTLLPTTFYFVVLTAGTSTANGAYEWDHAAANNYNPNGGWASLGGGWTSSNGTTWNDSSAVFSQFAINATAAPEPGTWGLLALGVSFFGLRRWNEKKRS